MGYAQIRTLLAQHQPADSKERADLAHIRALLEQYDTLLSRTCPVAHITGSAIIMDARQGRVLLMLHRKLNRWVQPGGHGDGETDPADIALREAREETGLPDLSFYPAGGTPRLLDIDVHTIPRRGAEAAHEHLDFRYLLLTTVPEALNPAAGEVRDQRWLTMAEAMDLPLDKPLRRLLRKASECGASTLERIGHAGDS